MNPETIFYLIVGIIIIGFLFDNILSHINTHYMSDDLPDELKGIYKPEEYKKSQSYKKAHDRVGLISGILNFILILFLLFLNGFAWLDTFLKIYISHPILLAISYLIIIGLISSIINLPFQIYNIFVIEEKFGFNKTTIKTFITDKLKSLFLSLIIGGGLMALIIYIYLQTQVYFWIYAWLVITIFSIFMAFFYSTLIVPLFNKQTPLEEGELRSGIQNFVNKIKFSIKNIFVIDGSKRTTKANAYFSGLGRNKRIVLYDNLINDLDKEEIISVLAHEVGHYKKRHVIKSMIISIIESGIMLFLFGLLVGNPLVSQSLGVSEPSFHIGLIVFGILYSPLSTIFGILQNIFSRKNEYEADNFVKENHNSMALAEALKKISVKALSNLRPHPLYVFVHYSHPTLLQRINNLSS